MRAIRTIMRILIIGLLLGEMFAVQVDVKMQKTKKNSPTPIFGIIIFLIVVVLIIGLSSFLPFSNLPLGKVGEYTVGPVVANVPGNLETNPAPAIVSLNDTDIVFKANDNSYNLKVTVTDYAVIRRVYLCESPCTAANNWTQVGTFTGTTLGGNYLVGSQGVSASITLDRNKLNRGNNFLSFYSCSGVGLCHNGKWVQVPFTVQYDLPDLVVDSIIFGQPIGTNLPVTVVIKNIGVGTSFNTVTPLVAAYTVQYTDLQQQSTTTQFSITQDMAANSQFIKSIIVPLGESLSIKVNASVDIFGQKPESNEDNNHKMETQILTLSPPGQVGALSTVSPRPLTCSVKTACDAGETNVLELTDPINAHVALPGSSYPQKVCCSNGNGPITVGTGDAFAYLSGATNAHIS